MKFLMKFFDGVFFMEVFDGVFDGVFGEFYFIF